MSVVCYYDPLQNAPPYKERWSSNRIQECVDLWNLTELEQETLLTFQDRIVDLKHHWKNDPFEVVRFLREFKFDLKTTEQKFRRSIEHWRRDHFADTILEDYCPPKLYQYFPCGVLRGTDHDGDPIYIERTGAADTLGLLHRFGREEMVKEAIWMRELMTRGPWIANRKEAGGQFKYFTVILDLKGLNRHHLHPALVPVGQQVTRLIQDNYPGIGKKILVVRAPGFFRFVWNVFKHFVDPHVKELIEIASTEKETNEMLAKYMDLKVLPKEVCPQFGQGVAEEGFDPVWEGGAIPKPSEKDKELMDPVFSKKEIQSQSQSQSQSHLQPQSTLEEEEEEEELVSSNASSLSTSWEQLPQANDVNNNQHPITHAWSVTPIALKDRHEVWSDHNFQKMANIWNLNQKDKDKMKELQQRIADIHHWKNDPFEVIRYYQEYKGKLDKVEHMFRNMIQWRMDHDMETYLQRYGKPNPIFHNMCFCMLDSTDKEGDPIYVDRMGACDYWSLYKHLGPDAITEFIIFALEMNNHRHFWKRYERKMQHRPRRLTSIIDMEGLNHNHMRPALLQLLKRISRIAQDYYPGWEKNILIIRAPKLFTIIWSLVRHFFDPQVRKVIQVAGHSDYMELLDQYIDREALPPEICPTEGKAKPMPGYYENVKLKGGPIPKEEFQKYVHDNHSNSNSSNDNDNHDKNGKPKTIHITKSMSTVTTHENNQTQKAAVLEPLPSHAQVSSASILLTGTWDDDDNLSINNY